MSKVRAVSSGAHQVFCGLSNGLVIYAVAVVTVAQFASARPDAGVSGNGMALPAITIAVLGGVAITGGIGRVAGVVLATLLIVWLNAGILLAFVGNEGSQYQLLALGFNYDEICYRVKVGSICARPPAAERSSAPPGIDEHVIDLRVARETGEGHGYLGGAA